MGEITLQRPSTDERYVVTDNVVWSYVNDVLDSVEAHTDVYKRMAQDL